MPQTVARTNPQSPSGRASNGVEICPCRAAKSQFSGNKRRRPAGASAPQRSEYILPDAHSNPLHRQTDDVRCRIPSPCTEFMSATPKPMTSQTRLIKIKGDAHPETIIHHLRWSLKSLSGKPGI